MKRYLFIHKKSLEQQEKSNADFDMVWDHIFFGTIEEAHDSVKTPEEWVGLEIVGCLKSMSENKKDIEKEQ